MLFERFNKLEKLSPAEVKSLVATRSKNVIPSLAEIDFGKLQRVKLGIDPTGAEVHVGHLAPLFILNLFAKAGHHVDFVIGDFTCKVGDPSGRVDSRPVLTDEAIAKNLKTYVEQVSRYFDTTKWATPKNSEWLSKITLAQLIGIMQNLNLATALQRDDFRKRLETGGITQAELLYGILQGMDSVALKTTIELGGNDQLLNLQQGRELQRIHGQPAQAIIVTPLLEGLCGTGKKMSKSLNNYIAINSSPEDKFGKLMSLPDNLLLQYYTTFGYLFESDLPALQEFIKANPMEAKKQLATYFISIEARDLTAGQAQREAFEKKFSKRELTDGDFQVLTIAPNTLLLDALMTSGKFKSKGELKRLLASGAIRDLDRNIAISEDIALFANTKVKVGKLNFFQFKLS